jgi:hypothetical protein
MTTTVFIGASRAKMLQLAEDIKSAFSGDGADIVEVEAETNDSRRAPITLSFSNDDMEDRDDLAPDMVLVDVDTDL